MDTYSYYTDGAATMVKENGKYLRQAGGWAFILLKNDEKFSKQSGGCPLTTNNEMELYAIYASFRDFLDRSKPGDKIEIYSDSAYCIGIFTQWARNWEKKGWKRGRNKSIENLKIIKEIWSMMKETVKKDCKIDFIKVKGHCDNLLNNEVDKLAVKGKKAAKLSGETSGYGGANDPLLGTK